MKCNGLLVENDKPGIPIGTDRRLEGIKRGDIFRIMPHEEDKYDSNKWIFDGKVLRKVCTNYDGYKHLEGFEVIREFPIKYWSKILNTPIVFFRPTDDEIEQIMTSLVWAKDSAYGMLTVNDVTYTIEVVPDVKDIGRSRKSRERDEWKTDRVRELLKKGEFTHTYPFPSNGNVTEEDENTLFLTLRSR